MSFTLKKQSTFTNPVIYVDTEVNDVELYVERVGGHAFCYSLEKARDAGLIDFKREKVQPFGRTFNLSLTLKFKNISVLIVPKNKI